MNVITVNHSLTGVPGREQTKLPKQKECARQLRRIAGEKKLRIQANSSLSALQRKIALEMLRQQTEDEMQAALGRREFFKAFHSWWFRGLATAE